MTLEKKFIDTIKTQLGTDYNIQAEECIEIYNKLKELNNGKVWQTEYFTLVKYGYIDANGPLIYFPSEIGKIFLDGLKYRNKNEI